MGRVTQTTKAATTGKDPVTGKFLKGHTLAKGNPFLATQNKFRAEVYKLAEKRGMDKTVNAVFAAAELGDMKAATLLFDTLGVRVKHHEVELNATVITPDEARAKVSAFFGLN